MAMSNGTGSVAGNAQNISVAQTPRTRSTFELKRHFFNTHRFGEYIPFLVGETNDNESFSINSSSQVRTYTLKSPLMQSVKRNKDYFVVPMEAILPNNWWKFYNAPVRGDDVLDDVGPTVENFWSKVYTFWRALRQQCHTFLTDNPVHPNQQCLLAVFRCLILGEYFYSNGNLLASLGFHGAPYFDTCNVSFPQPGFSYNGSTRDYSYDEWFDLIINVINGYLTPDVNDDYMMLTIQVDGYMYSVSAVENNYGLPSISLRHALQLMRDNPTFTITNVATHIVSSNRLANLRDDLAYYFGPVDDGTGQGTETGFVFHERNANVNLNLSRLWAYQLSVAHYFTNDHIDFVYSAELYRELIGHYLRNWYVSGYSSAAFFTFNGVSYEYDYMSAHFCSLLFTASTGQALNLLTSTSGAVFYILGYWSALFGYRRSLRYLDYFTGSRAQPMSAVGTGGMYDTNVSVVNNSVDVVNITRGIQAQRFRNSLNRIPQVAEARLKALFGGKMPAPDYHNPFKIIHADDVIYGQETENTATNQMQDNIAITTNLRGSGKFQFTFNSDRPCIIIGVCSYEIPRIYTKSCDRSFFHLNRYDWFNPFFQFVGDQELWIQELGIKPGASSLDTMTEWSYQIRNEEYKQTFNTASGAFCIPSTNLDNWIFSAIDRRGTQPNINPDWIRALNAEFDKFYVSLSGWSLGTYFHFIVDDYNMTSANRPMAFAPQILG